MCALLTYSVLLVILLLIRRCKFSTLSALFYTYFGGVVAAWGALLGWEGDEGRVSMEILKLAVRKMWVSNFVTLLFPVL